jgi:hypothetical protein
MRFPRLFVIYADHAHQSTVEDMTILEKQAERIASLGLTLAEATPRPRPLQQCLPARQVAACLATRSRGDTCGLPLRAQGQHTRTFRTLVGTITLPRHAVRSPPSAPSRPPQSGCAWRPPPGRFGNTTSGSGITGGGFSTIQGSARAA